MRQKGFATLEVILMVMVIGILASIAVPRFTSVTTAANTAKIQSDLSTIDTAIEVYHMEHGAYPGAADNINALDDYIRGASELKPPTGDAYVVEGNETKTHSFSETTYKIKAKTDNEGARAYLEKEAYTAEKFRIEKKSTTPSGGNSGSGTGGTSTTPE